ncbi:MAG: bacteriocin fulvocin C-related protein [Lutibacter sp.]
MDRIELSKLSNGKQRAAFRTFTPEKRKELWISKLKQIKSLDFSTNEVNHLKFIEKFINKYDFSKEMTIEQEKLFNDWFEEGRLKYGWTPYFLVSGFAILNEDAVLNKNDFQNEFPIISTRGIEDEDEDDGTGGGGSTDDCDCNWDITCQLSGLGDCSDNGCRDTTLGCGWLGMQNCTNDCSG